MTDDEADTLARIRASAKHWDENYAELHDDGTIGEKFSMGAADCALCGKYNLRSMTHSCFLCPLDTGGMNCDKRNSPYDRARDAYIGFKHGGMSPPRFIDMRNAVKTMAETLHKLAAEYEREPK